MQPNTDKSVTQKLDGDLRTATLTGDAHDVRLALDGLHDAHYLELSKALNMRLGSQGVVTSAEVIDEVMARIFNQLVDFAELGEKEAPRIVRRFLASEISGWELLRIQAGNQKRGVIGDLLRKAVRQKNLARQALQGASGAGKAVRQKNLARQALQGASGAGLPGQDTGRFSYPQPQEVIDSKARINALNTALSHLEPKERLAIALKYDVAGVGPITDQRADSDDRAALLYDLARSFGFQKAEAELLRYRFKDHVAAAQVVDAETPGSRGRSADRGELLQQDIAALLGIDPPSASRLIKGATQKLRVELSKTQIFAA